jgi:hypothetical protein
VTDRLLLDAHVALRLDSGDERLSACGDCWQSDHSVAFQATASRGTHETTSSTALEP